MSDVAFSFPYDPIAARLAGEDELVLQVERDRALEDYLVKIPETKQDITDHAALTSTAHGGVLSGSDPRLAQVQGTATLVAGTVTLAYSAITAVSKVFVHRQIDGGTVGASYSITRVVGTSFTITARDGTGAVQALDTSTVAYQVFQ